MRWWRILCRQRETGSELRSTNYDGRFTNFFVMDTDNNQEKAEHFVSLVRKQVKEQMAHLNLKDLTELLTSLVAHVALRDLRVANGIEVEPELAQKADAAVYFLNGAGLNLRTMDGGENHE